MALNDEHLQPPCGADIQAIVRQVFEGAPPVDPAHQATCEHCQRSLAAVRALRDGLRNIAAEPVKAPDVARQVLARLPHDATRISVSNSPRGATTVTRSIVAQVARRAAMEVPGVVLATVEVDGVHDRARSTLSVRLVVALGPVLDELAAAVRARAGHAVERLLGVPVGAVDIAIDDLTS